MQSSSEPSSVMKHAGVVDGCNAMSALAMFLQSTDALGCWRRKSGVASPALFKWCADPEYMCDA